MQGLKVRLRLLSFIAAIPLFVFLLASGANAQTKMVFAHYMVVNGDYQDHSDPSGITEVTDYEKEMLQAKAAGFDGFALNCGGWYDQTWYIDYSTQIFEAAVALNNGFKLMFSCDYCCGNGVNDAEDMMRRFCNDSRYSPAYFQYNGKYVLTTFSGDGQIGTSGFQQIRTDLTTGSNPETTAPGGYAVANSAAMNVFIVPAFFWGGETPAFADLQASYNQWSGIIDGNLYWGIAGVPGSGGSLDNVTSSEAYAQTDHAGGKLYMAPVTLQFWGANANRYYEYSGYSGMRKMWMDAINVSHPEWIEDITWNDFVEGTYVSPIDDPYTEGANVQEVYAPGYNHTHIGATALSSYFIQWYKTGVQPAITLDTIYWAYRTQPMAVDTGNPPVDNKYGPVADDVYVTCNLTAAATLKVSFGATTQTVQVPAGSHDVEVPFTAGFTPSFELDRNGATVISGSGVDQIQTAPTYNDYYYSAGFAQAPPIPDAPAGLTAAGGNAQVSLSWTSSSGATSYNVYEGTSAGGELSTPIATGVIATSYNATGLTNGSKYYFEVTGVDVTGESAKSTEASSTPNVPPPAAPTALMASVTKSRQITLMWSAGTDSTSFNVYRGTSTAAESSTPIATGVTAKTYVDSGLTVGTTYYYTVAGVNTAGASAPSNEASAKAVLVALHSFAAGLQMISAPVDDSSQAFSSIFDRTGVSLASWVPSNFEYVVTPNSPANTLKPCYGYWVNFAAATDVMDLGTGTTSNESYSIPLAVGWNMIGNPHATAVSASTVSIVAGSQPYGFDAAVEAGIIYPGMYTYGPSSTAYQEEGGSSAVFQPYAGYWIYALKPCTITFPGI